MIWEAVAAALVGLALLLLVFQPLLAADRTAPRADDEPADPEETRKGQALAALREIEFDRETGKLSDADYAALKASYTSAALDALRAEDAAAAAVPVAGVDAMIAARARAIRAGLACASCGPRPEPDAVWCSSCGTRLGAVPACARCGTALRPDGRFCAQCGQAAAAA